jgi:Na+/melibiose symporter-like transporter
VLLPATILPALLYAPRGVEQPRAAPVGLISALKALAENGPLQILMVSLLISELGYGIVATLFFLYLDGYLGLGASFSFVILGVNVATLLSLPVWEQISRWTGKRWAIMASWILQSISMFALAFIPRGEAGLVPVIAVMAANSFFTGAGLTVSPSMLGDIVDYDTFKTGGYRAGTYFAISALADKIVVAFGGGLAFVLLGAVGYDAVHPGSNGETANWGMLGVFAILPGVLRLASLIVFARYPLDARRQTLIRKRLEQREARARRAEEAP